MKIINFKYIALASLLVFAFGCEEYLEEDFKSGAPTDVFYSTADGLEALIVASYVSNKIWYGHEEGFDFGDVGTDMYTYAQQHPNPEQFTFNPAFNSSNGRLTVMWVEFYKGINSCNEALFYLTGETNPLSETLTTKRIAEVRYLRGFYLWHLAYTFGDIPLPLTHTQSPILEAERVPVADVYAQIMEDVTFAVDNLSASDNAADADFGRVTRDAALAFRARLNLNIGSFISTGNEFSFPGSANDYFTAAKADADAVIPNYSFYDDYSEMWLLSNNSTSKNLEGIWAINYSRNNHADLSLGTELNELYEDYFLPGVKPWDSRDGGHHGHLMWGMRYELYDGMVRDIFYGRRFRRYIPNKYLPDLYDEAVDARFVNQFSHTWLGNNSDSTAYPTWDEYNVPGDITATGPIFGFGDTSIVVTKADLPDDRVVKASSDINRFLYVDGPYFVLDYDLLYNADGTINDEGTDGRRLFLELSKFDDPERLAANGDGSERGIRDSYVFRLAEMYLIAAEADWRVNGGGYSYLETLADTRTLGTTTGAQLLAGYGINSAADLTLEFFLDERAREFPGEQIRWMDLRRAYNRTDWVARIKQYNEDVDLLDVHHYLRPIPQAQLDAVQNDFPQNTGY